MDHQSLDAIGISEGTEKSSLGVDYLRHYERIFGDIRNEPVQILEIGVARGASLRSWARFFPEATIIGVDINENCRNFAGGRITVEIGSQADPEFLAELGRKYKPDIIIDDGSHLAAHILLTFDHLFPILKPGGTYIIEDLYLHYGLSAANYHSSGGITAAEHFAVIARRLTGDYAEPNWDATIRDLNQSIDRVEFIKGTAIVQKRQPVDPMNQITRLWELAEKAGHAKNWLLLTNKLIAQKDFARANIAAQKAATIGPRNAAHLHRLAYTQGMCGNQQGAAEALREAVKLAPDNPVYAAQLKRYEAELSG